MSAPLELLKDIRGWLAHLVCRWTPLDRISWPAFLWLAQYEGDWIYRAERRAAINPLATREVKP